MDEGNAVQLPRKCDKALAPPLCSAETVTVPDSLQSSVLVEASNLECCAIVTS
jgi:hypothetical protein